uniref:AC4 protein n=1 Tax=Bean golden mosaic virus TaxID=10839 RepID=G9CLT5_9GEMI|nr:AC4 protein [Bean golden mosaic virus]AEI91325.1 AC4 protein [Bean golden mosaic virus]AEI91340.1 AC4 protein [Bean golden mosaic virus]AEI91345.1 AC4 protein [Bean golden mosaic virus]
MGNHICMHLFNSKESSSARIADSSTSNIQSHLPSPMPIYRVQNHPLMSSPTSRRTVITSNGVLFKSTEDLLEEVRRQVMMQHQRH